MATRCLQPMQRANGYAGGDLGFGVASAVAESRLEPPRQPQILQWPSGYGAGERSFTRQTLPAQRSPNHGVAERGFITTAGSAQSRTDVPRQTLLPQRQGCYDAARPPRGVQPLQRPSNEERAVASSQPRSRLDPPRAALPLQRPLQRPTDDERVSAAAVGDAQAQAPRVVQPQPFRHGPTLAARHGQPVQKCRSSSEADSAPVAATRPSASRPSPGRVEKAVVADSASISLDEFLDSTNAVSGIPVSHGDDDMMGDASLQQVPSHPKVQAEDLLTGQSDKVDAETCKVGAIYNLVDVPAKESDWAEYDLDRENSNAAALLLCHTATPKLSLHPRGVRVGGPVTFATASQIAPVKAVESRADESSGEAEGQQVAPGAHEPPEDVSLTWKLLGAADKVVEFFSSLRPIEENRRFSYHGMRQTLPNPKRLQPNELFESRQQDQLKQAANSLRDAVANLITASGTTNAENATHRLPAEIRSRFTRLRWRLVQALNSSQKPASDLNTLVSDLERFVSMCSYLAQVDPKDIDRGLRQDFISFSQRHSQDLESHCRTFKWMEEQQHRQSGNVIPVRGLGPLHAPSGLGAVREHCVQHPPCCAVSPKPTYPQMA